MRRYETFVIADPDITQEQRDLLLDRVKELIGQMSGMLVFEDIWGEKKLAYEIKKKERGYYVRFDYCGGAELVNEIERFFRIDDRALKYMTVLLDKDADLEKIKEEKAAAETKRELEKAAAEKAREEEAAAPSSAEAQTKEDEAAAAEEEQAPQETESAAAASASDAEESAAKITPSEKKEEA
jgi:small subunit ribosomal protein S6